MSYDRKCDGCGLIFRKDQYAREIKVADTASEGGAVTFDMCTDCFVAPINLDRTLKRLLGQHDA